jgi:replicative DNA helicase
MLFVGLPKQGKTWFLINVGKAALIDGHKVLHISLEMSENQISKRYHQVLYAIALKKHEILRTRLVGINKGELRNIKQEAFLPKHAFDDVGIHKYLQAKRRRIEKRLQRVRIKSFPTGQLTLREMESYLDLLESQQNFVPDILLIDYPQLMKLGVQHQRLEFGEIVKGIRGLAVSRNIATVGVSQSNRSGMRTGSKNNLPILTFEHLAEDFSQAMTADVILTYNQTLPERALKLARIYVAAARDHEDKWSVLISQNYDLGQFCWRSIRMGDDARQTLLERLNIKTGGTEDEDD